MLCVLCPVEFRSVNQTQIAANMNVPFKTWTCQCCLWALPGLHKANLSHNYDESGICGLSGCGVGILGMVWGWQGWGGKKCVVWRGGAVVCHVCVCIRLEWNRIEYNKMEYNRIW